VVDVAEGGGAGDVRSSLERLLKRVGVACILFVVTDSTTVLELLVLIRAALVVLVEEVTRLARPDIRTRRSCVRRRLCERVSHVLLASTVRLLVDQG